MANQEINLIKNIEDYGKKYANNLTTNVFIDSFFENKEDLLNDWWLAMKFFFFHAFMRGRRDELSEEYYKVTVKALKYFVNDSKISLWNVDYKNYIINYKKENDLLKGNCLSKENRDKFHIFISGDYPLIQAFTFRLFNSKTNEPEKYYINNDKDLIMIFDVMNFITTKTNVNKNIVEYSLNFIKDGKTEELYNQLRTIYCIGDKIATFFLRDLSLLFLTESEIAAIDKNQLKYFLPIDTWISKVCIQTGIIQKEEASNSEKVKENLIEKCRGIVNPLYFNQGAWYLGANSLDVLLELLKTNKLQSINFT